MINQKVLQRQLMASFPSTPLPTASAAASASSSAASSSSAAATAPRYAITIANNGAEAVAHVREASLSSRPFDVVLMDLEMPVLDGLQATRAIRDYEGQLMQSSPSYKPAVIIALSGNARKEHETTAFQAGIQAFITKPYSVATIISEMASLLRQRLKKAA